MEKYINYEMCKQCAGACCKQNGCIYMPEDFSIMSFEYLKNKIDEGNISISGQPFSGFFGDAWSFMLYLRARNVDAEIVDLITTGKPCKLLTPEGCSLTEQERPRLGLLVRPTVIGGPCQKEYKSETVQEKWLKYNFLLSKLLKYYTGKEVTEILIEQIKTQIEPIKKKLKQEEQLTEMEKMVANWYYKVMCDKPYYTPEETKKLKKCVLF